jgi:hypothetical protein
MIKITLNKILESISKNNKLPPPKKKMLIKVHIIIMFMFSPKKNCAKVIAEYSTKYPATSSASASGKSKGGRFVSANAEI